MNSAVGTSATKQRRIDVVYRTPSDWTLYLQVKKQLFKYPPILAITRIFERRRNNTSPLYRVGSLSIYKRSHISKLLSIGGFKDILKKRIKTV